ncbi:MAG: formyltransferase family protein [Proteocatella sp.]
MICIAGKNNIAVEILEHAINNYDGEIYAVPNANDSGKDNWQRSLINIANKKNIKILPSTDLLRDCEDLILLSLEYDKLVRVENYISKKLYNIHFSLLPKYKGMYTSAWPILNNETKSGVTLHYMDRGIDTGDIIDQVEFKLDINDTAKDLYLKYIEYSIELVKLNWNDIISGNLKSKPQNKFESTYYDKFSIDYKNIKINLNQTAINIHNQIRAFSFKEYQLPNIFDKTIVRSELTDEKSILKPGKIIFDNGKLMKIATIDYNIDLYYEY